MEKVLFRSPRSSVAGPWDPRRGQAEGLLPHPGVAFPAIISVVVFDTYSAISMEFRHGGNGFSSGVQQIRSRDAGVNARAFS